MRRWEEGSGELVCDDGRSETLVLWIVRIVLEGEVVVLAREMVRSSNRWWEDGLMGLVLRWCSMSCSSHTAGVGGEAQSLSACCGFSDLLLELVVSLAARIGGIFSRIAAIPHELGYVAPGVLFSRRILSCLVGLGLLEELDFFAVPSSSSHACGGCGVEEGLVMVGEEVLVWKAAEGMRCGLKLQVKSRNIKLNAQIKSVEIGALS